MIREERDPAFWVKVASHPQVRETLLGMDPEAVGPMAVAERTLPLAAEHGGFLFFTLDGFGRAVELHTLFTPEGWGREVHRASKAAFNRVFETAQVVVTYEVENSWRSRPPRSFGFKAAGDFGPTPIGSLRTWILTKNAWRASPGSKSCRF